jgi:hypothetical protein
MMALLTLPLGLLWVCFLSAAAYLLASVGGEIGAPSILVDCVVWLTFVGVGYAQWFVVVPMFMGKLQLRKRSM